MMRRIRSIRDGYTEINSHVLKARSFKRRVLFFRAHERRANPVVVNTVVTNRAMV
jgi:hypothetical protein